MSDDIRHWLQRNYFHTGVAIDALTLLLGEQIARGTYRTVYQHATNPDWVVKVETGEGFHNVREMTLWSDLQLDSAEPSPYCKWLAPCRWISDYGTFLIMDKTEKRSRDKYPAKIPAFLTDTKYENFGWLPDGSFVCHDYGLSKINYVGHTKKMVKAHWWSPNE
jgi:hypothetical protein